MITSTTNKKIIETSKLKQKKYRDKTGLFLIEGIKLNQELVKSHIKPVETYVLPGIADKLKLNEDEIILVNGKVFNKLATQKNPEGIISVVDKKSLSFNPGESTKIIFLDRINDPGNLGTIIRTADAAGFNHVYCSKNCADLFNEKTIRSTMGSLFHIPVKTNIDLTQELNKLKNKNFKIIGTSLEGELLYMNKIKVPQKLVLLLGSESHGISSGLLELCDKSYKLPIFGQAESLNVSVAAGIFMYAFADQKVT